MTFKSIGELAGTVLRNAKAARAIEVAQGITPDTQGRMEAEPSVERAPQGVGAVRDAEGRAPRTETKKAGKPFGGESLPASVGQRHAGEGTVRLSYRHRMVTDLRLVASNDGRGHEPRHASEITPSRRPRLSLVVCAPERLHG